jgi:hypothetical protein
MAALIPDDGGSMWRAFQNESGQLWFASEKSKVHLLKAVAKSVRGESWFWV